MDAVVRRNAFGSQVDSFETDLDVQGVGGGPMQHVFIRAPWFESVGDGVQALASVKPVGRDGVALDAVVARQDHVLASAFHPELAGDPWACTGCSWRSCRFRADNPRRLASRGVTTSGHSKWATIKHQKGAKDAKRGEAVRQAHQGQHRDRRP